MKKFISILISITLILGTVTIYAESSSPADKDGDICTNPWGELFTTTAEPTTAEPTTLPIVNDTELSITNVTLVESNGKKTFDVTFTAVDSSKTGGADPYLYCIYLDKIDSDHSAINLSAGWNWKDNFQWLNDLGGFNNDYKFDGAFTTAADFRANGNNSTYLEDGAEHKVIIVAYETVADAKADVNPIAVVEKVLNMDGDEPTTDPSSNETTTPDGSGEQPSDETTTPDGSGEQPSDETTTPEPTTPSVVDPTTEAPTTVAPTTVAPTTAKAKVTRPGRATVKKATKKKVSKKVKLSIKKVKGAVGYAIQFSKTKKFKKVLVKRTVKKRVVTINSKKLKKAKKLYVRVKAYKLNGKKKLYSKKWSKVKRVKIKK